MRSIWITWHAHRRTTGLSAAWNVPLFVVESARSPPLGWLLKSAGTLRLMRRHRPDMLFVQNPSLLLTLLAVVARPLFAYRLVVDAHNEGVRPFDRPGRVIGRITRYLLGAANATIVTNDALAKDVRRAGGRPVILSDPLPEPPDIGEPGNDSAVIRVAVVATYRPDEPVEAIVAAAAMLPDIRFSFSGDPRRFLRDNPDLPPNVVLAGYLPDRAYWEFLARATIVCDLTLKPDCLVCGAYEGLALAKPLLLSDNPATRSTFGGAAMLTDADPDSIARTVRAAVLHREQLEDDARITRDRYRGQWQDNSVEAWNSICSAAGAFDSRA